MCSVWYLMIFLSIFQVVHNKYQFKIGGLLPEINDFYANGNYTAYNSSNLAFNQDFTKSTVGILTAIKLAKSKIINYFSNYYNCNIDLDIKDTKVIKLKKILS